MSGQAIGVTACVNAYSAWFHHYSFSTLYKVAMDAPHGFARESLVVEGEQEVAMAVICIVAPKNDLTDLIMSMALPSDERAFRWDDDSLANAVSASGQSGRIIYTRFEDDGTSAVIFAAYSRELTQRLLSLCWCLDRP